MFGFGQGSFKPTIPVFNGKQESFCRWKQEAVIYSRRYGFDAVFTRTNECQDVNVRDPDSRWRDSRTSSEWILSFRI